jgi:predicted Rossmann fold flavoprotein
MNKYYGGLSQMKNFESRSVCPENFTGEKGKGGMAENGTGANCARDLGKGWKISPSVNIPAGETFELCNITGQGMIKHMWITDATRRITSFEDFLKSIGIYLTGDGKRYPVSYEANSVLDLIREKLSSNGVSIFTENTVTEIKYKNGIFSVVTDKQTLLAKKVIFGCGGKSQKQFGTDGTAYSLLTALGHTVTDLTPALVQLKTDTKTIKGLHGIKCDAVVKAFDKKGNLLKSQRSDVLFTDYGVSGLGVFQVSGHLLKENGSYLELEFLPDIDKNALKTLLEEKSKSAPYLDKEGLLNGLINKQLAKRIIAFYPDLITGIKNFKLAVIGSRGFDSSQVTKGGISVSEVNPVTMESKFVKGLYIVGEVLDVDGDSGGYNLQWAYSSGRCASNAILKEQND